MDLNLISFEYSDILDFFLVSSRLISFDKEVRLYHVYYKKTILPVQSGASALANYRN